MDVRLNQDFQTEGRKKSRALWIVIGFVVVALIGFSIAYAGKTGGAASAKEEAKEDSKKKAPIPVSVAAVETGAVSSYLSATANLVPDNEVKVLAEAEGRVARLLVEEGDWVSKGQTLVSLDRGDFEIVATKTRLKVENARLAFERGEKMVRESLISQEAFDKMKMDYEVVRQELAEAEYKLSKTSIRAPFSGRVTARGVEQGQHVRPGDELFTVADFEPLVARLYLPEKDILGLAPGRTVRITQKAAEDVRFQGRIRQISPVVDAATGTVKVTVEAVAPPRNVRPGGFVTVDIVRETRPEALLLPREAVLRELQSAHVFVVKNGVAQKRALTLGLEEGDHIEALSGIQAGEKVVVAGQGSLKQGALVKVLGTPGIATDTQTAEQRAAAAAR
jgi:RND family efflux transporter MFP subunit